MSDRDAWPDNPNDPTPQRAEKSGGSGCLKFALIVGGLSFIGLLVCCGGLTWFGWGFIPKMATTPTDVAAVGQQVMQIDIPDEFVGKAGFTIDNRWIAMRFATFLHKDGKGALLIGAMQVKMGDLKDRHADFKKRSQQQSNDQQKLTIKKTEEREFTIRGKSVTFKFSEAEEDGTDKKFRLVTGELEAPGSITILQLTLEEEAYDEDAVVKMIESIR